MYSHIVCEVDDDADDANDAEDDFGDGTSFDSVFTIIGENILRFFFCSQQFCSSHDTSISKRTLSLFVAPLNKTKLNKNKIFEINF